MRRSRTGHHLPIWWLAYSHAELSNNLISITCRPGALPPLVGSLTAIDKENNIKVIVVCFPESWLIFDETYGFTCCYTLFAVAFLVNFDACFPNHGFDLPTVVIFYSSRGFVFILKVFLMCCFDFLKMLSSSHPTKKLGWKTTTVIVAQSLTSNHSVFKKKCFMIENNGK